MTDPVALTDLPVLPLDNRKDLPDIAAIYFVLAGDVILYVGQSINLILIEEALAARQEDSAG